MRQLGLRLSTACVLALALAACNASDLQTPISSFSKATTAAQASLAQQQAVIDTALLDEGAATAVAAAREKVAPIHAPTGDCEVGSTRCRLVVTNAKGVVLPISKGALPDHGVLDLMNAINDYATDLAAIASSDSSTKVEAALVQAKTSVISLAGSADAIGNVAATSPDSLTKKASAYAAPVTGLITFGVERYLERLKINALTDAVDTMEAVLPEATADFDRLSLYARNVTLTQLADGVDAAAKAYMFAKADKAKIAAYRAAAEDYDAALKSPQGLFDNLAKAHTALAHALHHRDMTFAELWPYLQKVLAEAAQLATLTAQIEQAGKKS